MQRVVASSLVALLRQTGSAVLRDPPVRGPMVKITVASELSMFASVRTGLAAGDDFGDMHPSGHHSPITGRDPVATQAPLSPV